MGNGTNLDNLNYTDEAIEQIGQIENGIFISSGATVDGMTSTLLTPEMTFNPMRCGRSYSHYDFVERQRKREQHIKHLNDTCNTRQTRRKRERMAKKLNK